MHYGLFWEHVEGSGGPPMTLYLLCYVTKGLALSEEGVKCSCSLLKNSEMFAVNILLTDYMSL